MCFMFTFQNLGLDRSWLSALLLELFLRVSWQNELDVDGQQF